jgi:hypothetical protein
VTSGDVRPERHALLEMDGLIKHVQCVVAEGHRQKFDDEERFRWLLHRLWIAVGNEAHAFARHAGLNIRTDPPWASLYQLRNRLAHRRLPDIDEDEVWRISVMRTESLRHLLRERLR